MCYRRADARLRGERRLGIRALTENVTFGSWPDVLYLFYYPMAAIACGLLYFDLGGRLSTARSPHRLCHPHHRLRCVAVVHRARTTRNHERGAARGELVGRRLRHRQCRRADRRRHARHADQRRWRSERSLVWLLVAMVSTLVADLLWVNAELRGEYEIGGLIDLAYFLFYLCLFMSAWAQRCTGAPAQYPGVTWRPARLTAHGRPVYRHASSLLDDRLQLATSSRRCWSS
jgi:hypothetical protein